MKLNPKPIRIEPAFEDREQIRAMFERYAPYRALAAYAPEGLQDESCEEARRPVLPWFRGDWALGGKPLVEGAELILHNKNFLEAARSVFGTSDVHPEFVAVNINGPMPACNTHVDNPSFYGATRVDYSLPFLRVMAFPGCSSHGVWFKPARSLGFMKVQAAASIIGRMGWMVPC